MSVTARTVQKTAKKGTATTSAHSVRTPNDTWARAKARARRDGLAINRVLIELLEGYARGIYRLPQRQVETVRVYAEGVEPVAGDDR